MRTRVRLRDGAQLQVTVSGEGEPLVLAHGGPGLWDYLSPLARLLDADLRVVRYDQRGCGRSSGGEGPLSIEQFVDDLDQLRGALGLERWWVGGHSWGAYLALRYALEHPSATLGVVYISGTGLDDGYKAPYAIERERRLGADVDRWRELGARERTPAEEHEWCVLQWSVDYSPAVDGKAFAENDWAQRDTGVEVNHRCNRELQEQSRGQADEVLDKLSHLSVPVLVLHGDDDPRPASATETILDRAPRARRVLIKGAGHSPWVEQPALVRAEVRRFLAEGQ
jgi:proline iminopeptidase